jgi:hypothetical protein
MVHPRTCRRPADITKSALKCAFQLFILHKTEDRWQNCYIAASLNRMTGSSLGDDLTETKCHAVTDVPYN